MIFRKAVPSDKETIWKIIQDAIEKRKGEGSHQWQDGYPNLEVIEKDLQREIGYVLTQQNNIIGYIVILINNEPAYNTIEGKWLSTNDFVVFHRIAIAKDSIGKGYATSLLLEVEKIAKAHSIKSIKFDTNFDNHEMLYLAEKLGYTYCGEILIRNNPRKAFEKLL